eukprot:3372228-Rhodomonas_salina.1
MEEEHVLHLQQVLSTLSKHGLKASLKKSEFFRQEIEYLGHILDGSSVRMEQSKVEVITSWPRPSDLHELRSFLGL